MNFISCENCGIVLDTKRINFADEVFDLDLIEDEKKFKKYFAWDNYEDEWSLYLKCPACKTKILLNNGDKV